MVAKSDTFGFLTDQEALSFMRLMLGEPVNIAHRRNFSLASPRLANTLNDAREAVISQLMTLSGPQGLASDSCPHEQPSVAAVQSDPEVRQESTA